MNKGGKGERRGKESGSLRLDIKLFGNFCLHREVENRNKHSHNVSYIHIVGCYCLYLSLLTQLPLINTIRKVSDPYILVPFVLWSNENKL